MSSEAIDYVKKPAVDFIKDSWRLVKRCTKPDRNGARLAGSRCSRARVRLDRNSPTTLHVPCAHSAHNGGTDPWPPRSWLVCSQPPALRLAEFSKIAQATSVGFFIMGFIGFFVKLIFIPINNIIVGMG